MKTKTNLLKASFLALVASSVSNHAFASTDFFSAAEALEAIENLGDQIEQVEDSIDAVRSLSELDIKLDVSGLFGSICSSTFGDPEIASACATYSTLYVSSLAPDVIAGLQAEEASNASNATSLMSVSKISGILDYTSQTFTEILGSGGLISSDGLFENALEEIVRGRYSDSYLAGLTATELTALYESEWDNLRNLVDMSDVGGTGAGASSIGLTGTEWVDEETTTLHEVDLLRCEIDFPVTLCYDQSEEWLSELELITLGGTSAHEYPSDGTFTPNVLGGYTYSYEVTTTTSVEQSYTYDYNPGLNAGLSLTDRTATHTASASTYDASSDTMNTFQVIGATMDASLSCMKWELRGICIWLKWSWTGPKIKTTLKVRNYVPELTFQTYSDATQPPWEAADTFVGIAGMDYNGFITRALTSLMGASGSYRNTGGGSSEKQKTSSSRNESNFKLVDAFGNPAIEAFNLLSEATLGIFCPPNTNMFVPHYISNMDLVNWRQYFGVEFWNFRSWVLGSYMLGEYSDNNHYGSIYPRIGFNNAEDEIKSAVLTTYRAAHFITRENTLRVVNDIYIPHKDGLWVSNELEENNDPTGKFQQLMPHKDRSCKTFPLEKNPDGKRRGETGSTMWNFWRRVECCKKPFGKLIFKT